MNEHTIMGNLGANGELRYNQKGDAVLNMRVATNISYKVDGERRSRVTWHKVAVWGRVAEKLVEMATKGRQVLIKGEVESNSWDDKDGVKRYSTQTVVRPYAGSVQFLGPRKDNQQQEEATDEEAQAVAEAL
jgi:single-strand DNA-binding protein